MPKPKFVQVHQNGDSGPVVEVSAAYAENLGLTPIDSEESSPKSSARRRRAAAPSQQSGGESASTPEEASA